VHDPETAGLTQFKFRLAEKLAVPRFSGRNHPGKLTHRW
jgi:hypothetical protein